MRRILCIRLSFLTRVINKVLDKCNHKNGQRNGWCSSDNLHIMYLEFFLFSLLLSGCVGCVLLLASAYTNLLHLYEHYLLLVEIQYIMQYNSAYNKTILRWMNKLRQNFLKSFANTVYKPSSMKVVSIDEMLR